MTEAQKCLYHIAENMRMDKSISKEGYEYFQQAIKALEQQSCEDCVSREQLIKLYNEYRPSLATRVCEFGEKLKELPSVKPATVWHMVEDELPNESGEYIVEVYDAEENENYIDIGEIDCDGFIKKWNYKSTVKVLAWMPLPESFRAESEAVEEYGNN